MPRKKTTNNIVKNDLEATICRDDQSTNLFKPGDIAWTRIRDSFWWPCQVVDEESVSFRPKKKVKDGALVRMYGCYDYLYMDPVKCSTDFEMFLKQENLSIREAFQKAIDEGLSRVRSGGKSKRKVTDSREKSEGTRKRPKPNNDRERRTRKQGMVQNADVTEKANSSTPKAKSSKQQEVKEPAHTKSPCTTKSNSQEESTPNMSERRMRVMQNLGLIPPMGSPYRRNGFVLSSQLK